MKSYVFEAKVTALSSISHNGGQSYGINSKLRREKFVLTDGSVEEIPVISGNGIRGLLRDRGMLHMCRALGIGVDDDSGKVDGLSLPAFYFLFSGGSLTKDATRGLDVDEARRIRDLIPLVAIFGGAMGNQIMPGKLKCGKMVPICAETMHLLPDKFIGKPQSIWEYLQEEMYTRKDDEKNENLRQALSQDVRLLMDQHARQKRLASSRSDPKPADEQNQQMMYYVETFAAGTLFYWKLVLDDVTDVEFEAFATALVEFSKKPYVGGKSNVGLGEIAVSFDNWMEIKPTARPAGTAIDFPLGSKYARHLEEKGSEILRLLGEIA